MYQNRNISQYFGKRFNEAGERYLFVRDALGEVKSETGFDGQRRVYFRDAARQVEKVLLPGNKWDYLSYDAAGRVTEVKHFDGTSERYEYGPDGSLLKAANDETEVVFERDALGRVLSERSGEVVVTSRYGPDGARGVVESSLGARQAVLYDALGEVESLHHGPVSDFWHTEQRFSRDPLGAELSHELPGGVRVSWNRDASGKPIARHTLRNQPGAHPVELNARGYQWRGEDQIAAIVDAVAGPRWFDHDGRGRLIRERRPGDSPIHGDRVLHRAMDAVGNIYRSPDQSDRRYGSGGRIEEADGTKYEHDVRGNLVRKTDPDGSEWRYFWNGAGMLVKVERPDGKCVGFEYDVFARRTRKILFTEDDSDLVGPRDPRARRMQDFPPWEPKKIIESETRFIWDGHTVLHELSSDKGLTTWYWKPGTFTPVAKERGKQFWSLVHDHLGTPTEMYDEQGKLAWQMELDTFGKPTFGEGKATDCPWRWPGQYEDTETGFLYNRYRYLDLSIAGYVSGDPLGFLSGVTNFYQYVVDSVAWFDPLGLVADPIQVPYHDNPFYKGEGGVRNFVSENNLANSGGNIGVAQTADGTRTLAISSGGRRQRPRNLGHVENVLLNRSGIDPSTVTALYSEREPCRTCMRMLEQMEAEGKLHSNLRIYFTFRIIRGQESELSRNVRSARRGCSG